MAGISDNGNFALALQASGTLSTKSNGQLKSLQSSISDPDLDTSTVDDSAAREAANKFEALLIHNMLKSMRKTTMSEDTSNARAIYDDMLDEQLADTLIESGGLGIADQIVEQIREQQGTRTKHSTQSNDPQRLRELAMHMQASGLQQNTLQNAVSANNADYEVANANTMRLATALWGDTKKTDVPNPLNESQKDFVASLAPHARRNAQRLGTSSDAIVAIAALETGWGRLVIKDAQGNNSHNLFGIKADARDNRYATTLTTEYVNGRPQKQPANFKTFRNNADAIDGFADFILENPRYATALEHASNPDRFLEELQHAGYATDPRYADKAKSIMRQIARN